MYSTTKELPLPPHFSADNAFDPYYSLGRRSDLQLHALDWQKKHSITDPELGLRNIMLLVIDGNFDFVHREGTLQVAGHSGKSAMENMARLATFGYKNLHRIGEVVATADTHLALQISQPDGWSNFYGLPPIPNVPIPNDIIQKGHIGASRAMARYGIMSCGMAGGDVINHFTYYSNELAKAGKYEVTPWEPHGILGSQGHALNGVLDELRAFHGYVREVPNHIVMKGQSPWTEHYSVLEAEVKTFANGKPIPGAELNEPLFQKMARADKIIVAGWALSHCVNWSLESMHRNLLQRFGQNHIDKIYILKDCTSSVVIRDGTGNIIPDLDYTAAGEAVLQRCADQGMHIVESTTPMEEWPGMYWA